MIHSGIAPLDQHLGGMIPGRLHLLTGGPGTGKSTACLHFLHAGLQNDETVSLLTLGRLNDLSSHARSIGLQLGLPIRTGRLVLLRYRADFTSLVARTTSPYRVIDDLSNALTDNGPKRIVIDPVTPFLADGSTSGATLAVLAQWLDGLGVTSIVTYPADLSAGYDARLDPLVQRAASIFHITRAAGGICELQVLHTRTGVTPTHTAHFATMPVGGLRSIGRTGAPDAASLNTPRLTHAAATATNGARKCILVHAAAAPARELETLLRRHYQVTPIRLANQVASHIDLSVATALVVETNHTALEATTSFIRELGARGGSVPVIVVSERRLRSLDSVQLLRAGADEVLACDLSADELSERIAAVVRRGHSAAPAEPALYAVEIGAAAQPGAESGLLEHSSFSATILSILARDPATPFALVLLTCPRSSTETLREVGALVMRSIRTSRGDVAALYDDRIVVCLQGARLRDTASFSERVRAQWSSRRRALHFEVLTHPADEVRVQSFLEVAQPL
jgi:KaiC/GvpD/RAD55 family RecA-like ATPase/DNA-binding NarL/FixJ family response regulator